MFASMFAWFMTPLGRKVAIYAFLAIALFFAYRWWSGRIYDQAFSDGKRAGISEAEKVHKVEWAKKEAELEQAITENQQARVEADTKLRAAQEARNDARKTLNDILAESKGRLQATHGVAISITSDAIDDALRRLSGELAAYPR